MRTQQYPEGSDDDHGKIQTRHHEITTDPRPQSKLWGVISVQSEADYS